jgi:polysaccharide biosynthesis protein PslG
MNMLRIPHYVLLTFIVFSALALVGLDAVTPRTLRVGVHTIRPDAENLARAADLGVDTVVQLFPWREVEATQGRFNWQMSDEAVAGAAYYGLHLLVRLDQPPDWALVETDSPGQPPFDLMAYERFVRAVAERYQGQVAGYIIWNEPNLALEWADRPPDPAGYVALLRAGHRAVTSGDPAAQVISAGLAPTNTNNDLAMDDRRFLEEMYHHGAANFFHVLGAHAYGFGLPPDEPFLDPTEADSDLAGLVFARLPLLRQIMVRHSDQRKPVYVTEMGWTVEGVAHSGWQGVTPEQQAEYLIDSIHMAEQQWPWLALMTVWNVGGENDPEWQGYSLLEPDGMPRPAYRALQERLDADSIPVQGQRSPHVDRYQVLAADVTVHLGDTEMPDPWVPLYKGRPRSPRWEGVVYMQDPGAEAWKLTLRVMQSNFWSNRVWVNGEPLPEPMPIDDFSRTWVAHTWAIPAGRLRPGPNQIAITLAHSMPLIQAERFTYDDLQIKDIVLWRGN